MMNLQLLLILCLSCLICNSQAALLRFNNNPNSNWLNYMNAIYSYGGFFNILDFDVVPSGPFDPLYYKTFGVGVNISFPSAPVGSVLVQPSCCFTGSVTSPHSTGEGPANGSPALFPSSLAFTMIINFGQPVLAAGFGIADLYNPNGVNQVSVLFYDGPNGSGNLLDAVPLASYCFQQNYAYFIGIELVYLVV